MSLRDLVLDTFARDAVPGPLAQRWAALSHGARTFRRLLAVEYCAPELLARLHELGIAHALRAEHAAELRDRARKDSVRMLGVRLELDALLAALRDRGIPVTLLKGAALLKTGLRPHRACTDLDLLVDAADIRRAVEVLVALGYRERAERADEKSLPSYDRPGAAPVELHYRALVRAGGGDDELWEITPVADGVAVLSPTDWCWHTLAHEAYHSDTAGRTRGALDVAALVDRYGAAVDWGRIASRARRWPDRVEPVSHSLRRLGYSVPLKVSRRARWSIAWAGVGREYAARVAARDDLFVFAVQKLGGLAFAAPTTWAENRRREGASASGAVPAMLRDAARLAQVMLGREPAVSGGRVARRSAPG